MTRINSNYIEIFFNFFDSNSTIFQQSLSSNNFEIIDEITRRNRERLQNITRREDFSQFKLLSNFKRNDDIFMLMTFFNLFAVADDRLANLAFFLQSKQSKSQSQIVFDDNHITF